MILAGGCLLAGCVGMPVEPVAAPPPAPPPDTSVYFYPSGGRNVPAPQQDRDKFECNDWAVKQTGFDPSLPHVPPHRQMRIVAGGPPPGSAVGAGAVTGAVVGAAIANPWESGRGALLGAVAGAAIGGIAEAERAASLDRMQAQANQANANAIGSQAAAIEMQASHYRRALGACLEARGYTVR